MLPRAESAPARRHRRTVLAIALAGLALRLIHLGQHSLWFDEALEVRRAQTPWSQTLFLNEGPDPPGLRLVLTPIASRSVDEFWLRLPCALFGAATIVAVWAWLAAAGLSSIGWIAALLVAIMPVQVYYSQEVSQYSLAMLMAALLLLGFELSARFGRDRDWLLLSAATWSAIFSYYGVALLLPALDVSLALRLRSKRDRRQWTWFVAYHGIAAVAVVVVYELYLRAQFAKFSHEHLQAWFLAGGVAGAIRYFPAAVVAYLRFNVLPYADAAPTALPLLPALLALLGAIFLARRGAAGRAAVAVFCATLLLMYCGNGFGLYPFGHRYTLPLFPLFVALLASGLASLGRRVGLVVGAGFAILLIGFLPNLQSWPPNPWLVLPYEDLRPVLEWAEARRSAGELIYLYYGAQPAYVVYRPGAHRDVRIGEPFRGQPTAQQVRSIVRSVDNRPRFWLVSSHLYRDELDAIVAELQRTSPPFRIEDEIRGSGAAGFLFVRQD